MKPLSLVALASIALDFATNPAAGQSNAWKHKMADPSANFHQTCQEAELYFQNNPNASPNERKIFERPANLWVSRNRFVFLVAKS